MREWGDQGSIIPGPGLLPIEAAPPVHHTEATEGTLLAPCVGHVNSTVLCELRAHQAAGSTL